MSGLEDLRRRIDAVDHRIVELLTERFHLAGAIGQEKEAAGLSLYDPLREKQVLESAARAAGGRFPVAHLQSIFREIISASRARETDSAVLVHGAWGSLAHFAAFLRFGASARIEVTSRAEDLFAKLQDGSCAYGLVCLEGHSLEASIDRLDLFLHSKAVIFGELYVRPRLGLFAQQASAGEGPIFGSPSVLHQAARWIERQPSSRQVRVSPSMRDSVQQAREAGGAVLGYPVLEVLESLVALESGIEDLPEVTRRFLILSCRQAPSTGRDKTSILAVIENRAGQLHRVVGVLSRHGINLCWLEPKATHLGRWDHLFVLEMEGHQEDPSVAQALLELRTEVAFLQVLGSYPSETPPERPF